MLITPAPSLRPLAITGRRSMRRVCAFVHYHYKVARIPAPTCPSDLWQIGRTHGRTRGTNIPTPNTCKERPFMASSEIFSDRFTRQQEFVPMERLAELRATVIGVGAIGRQ